MWRNKNFVWALCKLHFSASMHVPIYLFEELWWKKTIITKSLNWIITLLGNDYKKTDEKLIIELQRKRGWNYIRMKYRIRDMKYEIWNTRNLANVFTVFFNCRFLINKINYLDRITSATEVNDEIISLNVHVCVMVHNSIIILLIIDDVSLHSNYKATRLNSFSNTS